MHKIGFVVFREFLEISLILGIIYAAFSKVKNFRIYFAIGVMSGVFASSLMALLTPQISSMFDDLGEEILQMILLFLTVITMGFTSVWMKGYSAKLKNEVESIIVKINEGSAKSLIISSLVFFTIVREFAEIILYVYTMSMHSKAQLNQSLSGFILGAAGGLLVGLIMYLGMLKMAQKHIFRISSTLLIFIAAGLALEIGTIALNSGMIDIFNQQMWDTSMIIRDGSAIGKALKGLLGYTSKPTILEFLLYFTTLITIFSINKIKSNDKANS
jgi:high-affinity iron transporter